jgi:DNA repair protein RadC
MNMSNTTLYVRDERGTFLQADGKAILAAAQAHLSRRVRRGTDLTSPALVRDFLGVRLSARDCEYFCVITLDTRNRMIQFTELCRGTIDGAAVHPREVVKLALAEAAASVILAHNHPSGIAEPSVADRLITARLQQALALVDIKVIDHVIVAGGESMSFAERGLL